MTTLTHPHVDPPLEIEVEDDRVPAHLEAGWLLAEESSIPTPTPTAPEAPAEDDEEETPE